MNHPPTPEMQAALVALVTRSTGCDSITAHAELIAEEWNATEAARNIKAAPLVKPHAFVVDVVRADGTGETFNRLGGCSMDAADEGMQRAGLGGVVRVRAVELAQAQ